MIWKIPSATHFVIDSNLSHCIRTCQRLPLAFIIPTYSVGRIQYFTRNYVVSLWNKARRKTSDATIDYGTGYRDGEKDNTFNDFNAIWENFESFLSIFSSLQLVVHFFFTFLFGSRWMPPNPIQSNSWKSCASREALTIIYLRTETSWRSSNMLYNDKDNFTSLFSTNHTEWLRNVALTLFSSTQMTRMLYSEIHARA